MAELLNLRRFLELERRVHKIERKLDMDTKPVDEVSLGFDESIPTPPMAKVLEPAAPLWVIPPDVRSDAPLEVPASPATAKPQAAVPPPLPVMPRVVQDLNERKAEARGAIPRVAPVVMYAEPPRKKERKDTGGALETMIGLNWTGWIGAIVLVIGGALAIKYGYEMGWFKGMPKEVRLGFCFSVGLALLGVGEWVDRRVNRISAAGVFAAGIATLFVVSYAGFSYFELYAQPTAFVLMGIATLVGSAIALRKNLVVIATLSLLGGNIAPIVLHSAEPRLAALLGYILALQLVALFLANVGRGGKWWILRGFAIAMPALWTAVVYLQSPTMTLPLTFSIVYAVLVQAELIFASGRLDAQQRGLIAPASILVTALLTVSLLWGLHDYSRAHQGLAMLTLAAACYGPGLILRKVREELSFAYRVSAALLLLVAVPVGLNGAPVIWAWAGLSLAYVIVGRKIGSQIGWWFGMGAWILAVGNLMSWSYLSPMAGQIVFLGLPAYCVTAIGLTLVGHVMSQLVHKEQPSVALTIDIIASGVFLVATIAAMESWHATAAITGYAWAIFIAGRLLSRDSWELHGGALLLAALVKWACVDMLTARFSVGVRTAKYLPVFNPIMGIGTAIAGSVVGMYAMQRKQLDDRLSAAAGSGAMAVATFIIAVMTFGLSVEIADVVRMAGGTSWPRMTLQHMGWTMLWTSALAIHAGLIYKLVAVADRRRWLGFTTVMMAMIAIKFLAFDVLVGSLQWGPWWPAPVVNLQTLACLVVVAGLALVWWLRDREGLTWGFGGVLLLAILLIVGTVEIARTFSHFGRTGAIANGNFAMQVAISIYWAVFAVAAIVAGFRLRIAGLRYFGLVLLAVSLMKVVGFDLSEIGRGYRILSFIGLGGLLLATSVVYGKLSPILLKQEAQPV